MSSDFDKEVSSDDLRHESSFYAYVDALCTEDGEHEGEVEAEFVDRTAEDGEVQAPDLHSYSKSYLFDLVYVEKQQEEDEEEGEEETTRAYEDHGFSPVGHVTLSEQQRREIVQKIKDLFSETKVLMVVNKFLQKSYIDANRKSPSMANALDKFDESLIFEDSRYQAALEKFAQTRLYVDGRTASLTVDLGDLENWRAGAESEYARTFEDLLSQQLALAKKTKPPKYTKELWLARVEQLLNNQRQRAAEVTKIRLAQVHLQGKLAKVTARLKGFDSLGPGFSIMDYEYLLKRNSVYSERRDEQREHIVKLNERNLISAAIIRHVDEEADMYNEKVVENSDRLDALVDGNKRERSKAVDLAKTKVSLSKAMGKLREQIGLLNYPFSFRKMERDLREIAELRKRGDSLHARMIADAEKIAKCRL